MKPPFRVALSGDFCKENGEPVFPVFDTRPLTWTPGVEMEYLASGDEIDSVLLEGFDAFILLSQRFTAESVPESGRLAIVARFGVGYDNVDIEACTQNGIAVTITPDGVRRPVAVAILTLILALAGKLLAKDRLARQGPEGFAARGNYMGTGLVGKTLGSIGIGNIGAEMFRLAKPLDMQFISCDPYANPATARELGVELVGMEEVFARSDILAVNCPLNEDTHRLVNTERLALMKPTSCLINTARGPIVDQQALTQALQEGRLAGAGLDVFESEPTDPADPLFALENVIVTPHALCWTDQCFAGIGKAAIKSVLDLRAGKTPRGLVNRDVTESPLFLGKMNRFA